MTDNKKKTHLIVTGRGGGGSGEQVQADWNQTDDTQVDYIKNKPTIPAAPVQSDWNEADSSSLAYINNKPTIPPQQWFGTQAEYDAILVKDPNVIYNIEGSDNVQADWNQTDDTQADYIKNKPTIPTVPAMATETLTFTLQGGTTKTIEFYIRPMSANYFYVEDLSGIGSTFSIEAMDGDIPTFDVYTSTDQQNWTLLGTVEMFASLSTPVPANGKLYIKATTDRWGADEMLYCDAPYAIGGNIMSLLLGDNFENVTTLTSDNYQIISFGNWQSETNLYDASKLVLPATTLTDNCYTRMFSGCTSLTSAPALPATTLTEGCYQAMFQDCTSLNSITTYAQDISASGCLTEWLDSVSATGDFYNLGGATYTSGASGIPSGWTEHTSL